MWRAPPGQERSSPSHYEKMNLLFRSGVATSTVEGFSKFDSNDNQVMIGFDSLEAAQAALGTVVRLGNTSTRLTYPVPDRCFRLEGIPGQAKDSAILAGLEAYCKEAGVELMGLPDRVTAKNVWLPPRDSSTEAREQAKLRPRARYNGTLFFTIFDTNQSSDIPRFVSIEVEPSLVQRFPVLTPSGTHIEIFRTASTGRVTNKSSKIPNKIPPCQTLRKPKNHLLK